MNDSHNSYHKLTRVDAGNAQEHGVYEDPLLATALRRGANLFHVENIDKPLALLAPAPETPEGVGAFVFLDPRGWRSYLADRVAKGHDPYAISLNLLVMGISRAIPTTLHGAERLTASGYTIMHYGFALALGKDNINRLRREMEDGGYLTRLYDTVEDLISEHCALGEPEMGGDGSLEAWCLWSDGESEQGRWHIFGEESLPQAERRRLQRGFSRVEGAKSSVPPQR